MESLKIRDKRGNDIQPEEVELPKQETVIENPVQQKEEVHIQQEVQANQEVAERRKSKPTFGQALMEKVKKFFEEVE